MPALTPQKYKVAIKCLVYNHEPYLRDCLEGFVMQQTDFPFVAIVHDDASTDRSADIIREYAAKYPDIIHPIYETENQWSRKDGSLTQIMNAAVTATGAPYIALCEGDDYWTDPHKLQKQVNFLESHPEYVLCFHDRNILKDGRIENSSCKPWKDDIGINELMTIYVPTLTVLYRNINIQEDKDWKYVSLDAALWIFLSRLGKAKYLDFVGATYRVHAGGMWSGSGMIENCNRSIHARIQIFHSLPGIDKKGLARVINDWIILRASEYLRERRYFKYLISVGQVFYFSFFYTHKKKQLEKILKLGLKQ